MFFLGDLPDALVHLDTEIEKLIIQAIILRWTPRLAWPGQCHRQATSLEHVVDRLDTAESGISASTHSGVSGLGLKLRSQSNTEASYDWHEGRVRT